MAPTPGGKVSPALLRLVPSLRSPLEIPAQSDQPTVARGPGSVLTQAFARGKGTNAGAIAASPQWGFSVS
jgi:hypothetical protein